LDKAALDRAGFFLGELQLLDIASKSRIVSVDFGKSLGMIYGKV
jgi:hypothetical protein